MEIQKTKKLINQVLLDMFLVNFLPGMIIYFSISSYLPLRLGSDLSSFVILVSISWFLGILIEYLFFNEQFLIRKSDNEKNFIQIVALLIGKIGVSIIFTIVFSLICYFITDFFRIGNYLKDLGYIVYVLRICFFSIIAIVFLLFYKKINTKKY